MAQNKDKALLIEVIGEDAVIEGIDFKFDTSAYFNVFGGTNFTETEAEILASNSFKFSNCVVTYCTDEKIVKQSDENVLASILINPDDSSKIINGKALVYRKNMGDKPGYELFTEDEVTELIDLCDKMVRDFIASME